MTTPEPLMLPRTGPVSTLDAAAATVRRGGWVPLRQALASSAPLAFLIVVVAFVETVEGNPQFRMLWAPLLLVSWSMRVLGLGRVGVTYVRAAWPSLPMPEGGGDLGSMLRTHAIGALGLCGWLLLFAPISWFGWPWVAFFAPLLAFRVLLLPTGLISPWLSRFGGLRGVQEAFRDGADRRASACLAELLMIVGTELLALNLFLLLALTLLLTRSLFGAELDALAPFLTHRNGFLVVCVLVFAAWITEPFRAAVEAVHFLDVRVRQTGLDLVEALSALKVPRRGAFRGVLLLAAVSLGGVHETAFAEAPPAGVEAQDQQMMEEAEAILRSELFRDPLPRAFDFPEWLDELLAWLREKPKEDRLRSPDAAWNSGFPELILSPVLLVAIFAVVALALMLVGFAWRRSAEDVAAADAASPETLAPEARAPEAHLDDAARLARDGHYREALRSLYLATLVALDRNGWVAFDAARTNGRTLALLPPGLVKDRFAAFTQLFEVTWYGNQPASEANYRQARQLAEVIASQDEAAGRRDRS